jgi:hypothetical protein
MLEIQTLVARIYENGLKEIGCEDVNRICDGSGDFQVHNSSTFLKWLNTTDY